MADPVSDDQEKLDELNAAMGIVSVKHGENQTVFVSDTAKMRGELQRRIRKTNGVTRTRVRYNTQTSKGF
jgi:hypothetical protein